MFQHNGTYDPQPNIVNTLARSKHHQVSLINTINLLNWLNRFELVTNKLSLHNKYIDNYLDEKILLK